MGRKTRTDENDSDELEQAFMDVPEADPVEEPSLDGLVKMTRDGQMINAHPTVVEEHKKNGWKLA